MKQTTKKVVMLASVAVILIALICLVFYLKSMSDYKKAVSNISFQNIDITDIPDGTYIGECDVNVLYAKVEVTVYDEKITHIEILEHKNDQGQSAETVIDSIVIEQKIEVDAVAGATNSSTVLKKAVENAFAN